MALTASEKEQILNMLDKMDQWSLKRVLASVTSFGNWLYNSLYSIYLKVKNAISSMWSWICSLF